MRQGFKGHFSPSEPGVSWHQMEKESTVHDIQVLKDVEEFDVFFEGLLIFVHASDSPTIEMAEDNVIEVGLDASLLVGVEDGDHVDKTPLGEAVRRLLAK